jgi:metalloendopeptidase OMA1, mitochondrial
MNRRSIKILPLAIAAVVILFQFFGSEKFKNPETGQTARVAMSSDQEKAVGLQAFQEVLSTADTIESGREAEMVKRVAQKLAPQTGEAGRNFEWSVALVRSEQVNAFCLPGGKIVVYTGILPVCQNEAGLATVMGHEIAHAIARHGSQRVFHSQIMQTALMGASFSLSDMDYQQRQTLMGLLGAGAQYGIMLPFGRDHEVEADQMGLLYMARAGFDPRESISFWERMAQAGGNQPPEFMSTHPSHGTRIARLQQFMPKALEEYQRQVTAR